MSLPSISRRWAGRRFAARSWPLGVLPLSWTPALAPARAQAIVDSQAAANKGELHFEETLRQTWAVMEVDPHYTKDGAIVLMHDDTLDRTTTGRGRVSDHSLAELRELRLKDMPEKPTPHQISTLDEALDWARGKTVLILDQKDVPARVRARLIHERHAQTPAMERRGSLREARSRVVENG